MKKFNKISFVVNHAAYLVSHRLSIVEKVINDKWGYQILIGKAGSKIMEEEAHRVLKKKKINFLKNNFDTSGYGISNILGFFQIFIRLIMFRPDVVHLISPKAIFIGGIISRLLKIPLTVIAITGVGTIFLSKDSFSKKIIKFIYLKVLKFILNNKNKKVIFQNSFDKHEFTKLFNLKEKDITIIPGSGVKIEKNLPKQRNLDSKNVLLPSRLLLEKGIIEYVEAAKIIKNDFKEWNFLIAGTADYNNPSAIGSKELKNWEDQGLIIWKGYVNDLDELYSNCSIVCLPSYREGFPKCLIEAASYGLPVVTTNVPGCRDAILPDKTGLLVNPKDAKSLADGLKKLIVDNERRKIYGDNGYNLAKEKFNISDVIEKTLKVYNKL